VFRLPSRDNLQDNCTVLASDDGYVDAGFTPVKLSLKAVAMVDLRLLADKADFKFQTWNALKTSDPVSSKFIALGSSDVVAEEHYDKLRQTKPAALASLLNLATTMKTIQLPNKTPLDYFEEIREHTYKLYEARGREDGHDIVDWLHAEEEIMEKNHPIAA
jgi:Protein of unknown function (DUF2934)